MEIFQSFLFGLTIAIAIGPIALLIINYGLNCSFKTAALSGTGAALADFTYSLIAFAAGTGIAVSLASYQQEVKLISSFILAAFGARMLYRAISKRKQTGKGNHNMKCKAPLISTYALTIINPLTILLFIGFAGRSEVNGISGILVNGLGVFTGSLIIQLSLALFGNRLKALFKNQTAVFSINVVSALTIIILGFSKII